ncbi:MAG: hypothetical protein HGB19_05365 [Chlorobiales bacterium]|jgi:hypothetical protein|nr:hypothetical protein [Chlorobiales bacterium]
MDIVASISGLVLLIAILMGFPKRVMTNAVQVVYARRRDVNAAQQLYRHRRRK